MLEIFVAALCEHGPLTVLLFDNGSTCRGKGC